jgi:hypothetical protein
MRDFLLFTALPPGAALFCVFLGTSFLDFTCFTLNVRISADYRIQAAADFSNIHLYGRQMYPASPAQLAYTTRKSIL